jgi:hypothetical protein
VVSEQPNNYAVAADRGIIMNKEGSWEVGLQANSGMMQTAFNSGTYTGCMHGICPRGPDGMEAVHGGANTGTGCWNWWGHFRVPLHEWTHTAVTFDGEFDKHYISGMLTEQSDCPGDSTQSKRLNKTPQVREAFGCTVFEKERHAERFFAGQNRLRIGARGGTGDPTAQFKGDIDEVMVFGGDSPSAALSDTDVKSMYTAAYRSGGSGGH